MDKKIKVLILTRSFPTKQNPVAAIWLLNQLEELKEYCDLKVIFPYAYVPKIVFLNPYHRFSDVPEKESIKGIEVYHPKYFMIPRVGFKLKLLHWYLAIESFLSYFASKKTVNEIMEKWDPDIVHVQGALSESLTAKMIKKRYKKPLLLTVYGEDITLYPHKFPSKYLAMLALKNADTIICQSVFLKNEIKKLGIKNKGFYIIPMGTKAKDFKPRDKNKARKKLSLPQNKKIILFVGHLVERKGIKYLIHAMSNITKKEKNSACYIIGTGYQEESLKKLAKDEGLGNCVEFLGQKTNAEVADYMNASDLLVLPSLNEGLPVVVYEALSCGTPVVATEVAGTPELVNKDVGFLVKPKNTEDLQEKIFLALRKKWNTKKLLERTKEFSTEVTAKKVFRVYNGLMGKQN
ncbi:glycosyltransferase [Candidatus Woesearchaeota archaeon]|nr:glycosyltransferase [Candidatus Woesearchaeota archaeon]